MTTVTKFVSFYEAGATSLLIVIGRSQDCRLIHLKIKILITFGQGMYSVQSYLKSPLMFFCI